MIVKDFDTIDALNLFLMNNLWKIEVLHFSTCASVIWIAFYTIIYKDI